MRGLQRLALAITASLGACRTASSQAALTLPVPAKRFVITTDELWLNLHHFLYVLGRAQSGAADARRAAVIDAPQEAARVLEGASVPERQAWKRAVDWYAANMSRKDAVFDEPLPQITRMLAAAGEAESLRGVELDSALAATMQSVAPLYRRLWWQSHRASNRGWRQQIDSLDRVYGPSALAFVQRAYRLPWRAEGFPVHVSAYANWAGAYSTDGPLLVVSSHAPANYGLSGLETVLHEGMHQWDDSVRTAIRRVSVGRVPPNISHAILFYTAGAAIHSLDSTYVPYADANGVWDRGWQGLHAAVAARWKPYLVNGGDRDSALAKTLRAAAGPQRQLTSLAGS